MILETAAMDSEPCILDKTLCRSAMSGGGFIVSDGIFGNIFDSVSFFDA